MRILVIDDESLVLQTINMILELDGHDVVAAQGGQAGLDMFESSLVLSKPFDMVITDLGMPHIDGCRVASSIKKSSPKTPVILLTGSGEAPPNSNHTDFDVVISKPPRLRELRDALAKCADADRHPARQK